jgi:hypothetical protein
MRRCCARPGLQRHVRVQTRAGAAPRAGSGHHHHLVVHRDTLATVAATYDVPVHALVAVNEHLSTSHMLLPGTIVVIPRLRQKPAAEQKRRGADNAAAAPVRGDAIRARRQQQQQQAAAPASGRGVSQDSPLFGSDPLVALLALGKSDQTAARTARSRLAPPTPAAPVTQRTMAVPQALAFVPSTGPSLQLCGAAMLVALVATTNERVRMWRRTGGAGGDAATGVGTDVTCSGEAAGLVRLLAPPSAVETATDAGVEEATTVQPVAEEAAVATPADAARRQRSASRGLSRKTPAAVSRSRALFRMGEAMAAEMLLPASDALLPLAAQNAQDEADAGPLPDADSALEELWGAGEAGADEDEYEGTDLSVLAEELTKLEPFELEVPPGWAPKVVDIADVEQRDEASRQAAVARITAVVAANLAVLGVLSLVR